MTRLDQTRSLPAELETYVAETLQEFEHSDDAPSRDNISEASLRVLTAFRMDIGSITDRDGPLATNGDLLVYVIPDAAWADLCERVNVYSRARVWARRVHRHAAREVARDDPAIAAQRVRARFEQDDYCAIVVEHP